MEGIGTIIIILAIIGFIVSSCKNILYSEENKKNSSDGLTYFDRNGIKRLLSNNHKCIYTEWHGCQVLMDLDQMKVIRNFTLEENSNIYMIDKKRSEEVGRTTYLISKPSDSYLGIKEAEFKDKETGETYIIKVFDGIYYYVNVLNGQIVRPTDYSKKFLYDIIEKNNIKNNYSEYNQWKKETNLNDPLIKLQDIKLKLERLHFSSGDIGFQNEIALSKGEEPKYSFSNQKDRIRMKDRWYL